MTDATHDAEALYKRASIDANIAFQMYPDDATAKAIVDLLARCRALEAASVENDRIANVEFDGQRAQIAALKAENAALRRTDTPERGDSPVRQVCIAEHEVEALRADAARLDWLQNTGRTVRLLLGPYPEIGATPFIRDAIDAAMRAATEGT